MMEDATGVERRSPGFPDKMMDAQDVRDFCDKQVMTN